MHTRGPGLDRSRRWFLRAGSAFGAAIASFKPVSSDAADLPNRLGAPVSGYGSRSRFEKALRALGSARTPQATVSYTAASRIPRRHHRILPKQGYPLRLVVPGFEGIVNIKWLHRLKLIDQPAMTRWETARYTDLLPDGKSRIVSFEMDTKSVITRPSGGGTLPGAGVYEIFGLAWSGRGSIARVTGRRERKDPTTGFVPDNRSNENLPPK